jgi:hypothetical protein
MHHHPRPIHSGRAVPGPHGPYRLALRPDAMHRRPAVVHRLRAGLTAVPLPAALETVRRAIRTPAAAALPDAPPRPAPR